MVDAPRSASQVAAKKTAKKVLRVLLAVLGGGLMVATIPIFFPVSWMVTMHGWLGLGEFPEGPIAVYLARSTSLLYAIHGTLMWVVSWDLDRYWPLVFLLGVLHVVIGLVTLGIDLTTPMPWYWTAAEGVPVAMAGLAIIVLHRLAGPPRLGAAEG